MKPHIIEAVFSLIGYLLLLYLTARLVKRSPVWRRKDLHWVIRLLGLPRLLFLPVFLAHFLLASAALLKVYLVVFVDIPPAPPVGNPAPAPVVAQQANHNHQDKPAAD